MKQWIYTTTLVICAALSLGASPPPDYEFYFGNNYQQSHAYCQKNRHLFWAVGRLTQTDPALITAVLFPEVLRYSFLRDAMETRVVEFSYVNYGAEAADFSIGMFQMRPSFAEQIEVAITQNEAWTAPFKLLVNFPNNDPVAIREERIKRLKEVNWQLFYACALCRLVAFRFGKSPEFQAIGAVRFTAAAYNGGFRKTAAQIAQTAALAQFPYGKDCPPDHQHPYSLVADDYYQRYALVLFKSL